MERETLPAGPSTSTQPPRASRTTKWVAGVAIIGALLGTAGIAMAQTSGGATDPASGSSAPSAQPAPDPTRAHHRANGITEQLLTGDRATKVSDAAKAAVPDGTIERVETDAEGSSYEAHVVKSDGTHVTVKVDAGLSVTTVEPDHGMGGQGGPPPPQGAPSATDQASGNV